MARLIFISHPDVVVDPSTPPASWALTPAAAARMRRLADSPFLEGVDEVWTSTERKARDAGGLIAAPRGLPLAVEARFDEIDRSATGFLDRDTFEARVGRVYAQPDVSIEGWETARAAQARILAGFKAVAGCGRQDGRSLAIVSHGLVGALLLAALQGRRIQDAERQPELGCFWTFDRDQDRPAHGWRRLPA